jgi:hypothetical protein
MKSKIVGEMVVPLKINEQIITLEDRKHWINDFRCSHYFKDQKMLLKGDFHNKRSVKRKSLVMCIKFGKKITKCNTIN